ncbi:competence/damage-inducible protein A [Phanerochaete sordida]|uniref:Competence/damage-inducible protein A n=1 Tax=Phanerochaete sordida TaxID=48140 RepID=A0A9P3LA21_9APHY|nr:competence/damage-inducible protein A [Phanerochaete sordida]
MNPGTQAGARLRLLSRHLARSVPPTRLPAYHLLAARRAMSSTVKSETTAPPATAAGPAGEQPAVTYNFPVSDVPPNPLGEGRYIKTAAALIIGDEILNGKTLDRNSNYFARYCFEQGIELKRIEVIADEEDEIVEASRRMVKNYDFVITSGGIGPTHDDITYASLAKAFNQPLKHHPETLRRMEAMIQHRADIQNQTEEQRIARERMALFPADAEVLYTGPEIWVPVVRLEGKLCVFPGIPRLFQRMLDGLLPYLPLPPASERPCRQQIFTSKPESSIAPYLTELQARTKEDGIRVGSYPLLQHGVYVSLIGYDREHVNSLAKEAAKALDGRLVSDEEAREMAKAKERGAA